MILLSCKLEPPYKEKPLIITKVENAELSATVRSSDGALTSLANLQAELDLLDGGPDSSSGDAFLMFEVFDELDSRIYADYSDSIRMYAYDESEKSLRMERSYKGAPFVIDQRVEENKNGLQISADIHYRDKADEKPLRSLQFSYLIPVNEELKIWLSAFPEPVKISELSGFLYSFGYGETGENTISYPLLAFWGKHGNGIALSLPEDQPIRRVTFSLQPPRDIAVAGGYSPSLGKYRYLRITFDRMGIGSERSFNTSLDVSPIGPHWRDALDLFVEMSEVSFEAQDSLAEINAITAIVSSRGTDLPAIQYMRRIGAGIALIDWNYHRDGDWIPPYVSSSEKIVHFDDSLPDSLMPSFAVGEMNSLLKQLEANGLKPVLYAAYSPDLDEDIAEKYFREDIAHSPELKPSLCRHNKSERYLMYAAPESPYGKQVLEQQEKMNGFFNGADGFFFSTRCARGYDFTHSDGISLIGNSEAANLSLNIQRLQDNLLDPLLDRDKIIAADIPGDYLAAEKLDIMYLRNVPAMSQLNNLALLGLEKPIVVMPSDIPDNQTEIEEILKELLVKGMVPSTELLTKDLELYRAYIKQFRELDGRRWVLEPDPVRAGNDLKVNLFRVPSIERPGDTDLLAVVVRPEAHLRYGGLRQRVRLEVQVPESGRMRKATWIHATRTPWPIQVPLTQTDSSFIVDLPPLGPAATVRIGRR